MNAIGEQAKKLNGKIVAWRRHFHANPELGMETEKTEAYIVEELKKMGVTSIKQGLAQHGIAALIEGGKPGKVLGIRADIDALNMAEDTGLPFASKNGWMHACGHDAHAAVLLATAEMLMDHRSELKGTVKLIFQPGEETTLGAELMINEGVLENPKVDAIIGLHTGNVWKDGAPGEVMYRYGSMMAATDFFTITFSGKGGHGAMPHLTVDPIAMACEAYMALQTIVSREINPLDSAVVTIGSFQGGTAENIIAPTCTLLGTSRALSRDTHKKLKVRIQEICENVARGMRGEVSLEFRTSLPPLINDREMTDKLREAAGEIVGTERVRKIAEPTMGGEDMACFMEKVPGAFFSLPSFASADSHPHHHPKFDIDESVLWIGSATFAQFALTWQ